MADPTAEEQLLLEYINAARIDPLGDAARYISSYAGTATSADAAINSALKFFGVSGPALLEAYSALTPVRPLAWNDALSDAAQGHDAAMIAADMQTHQAPGEAGLGARVAAAGYNYTLAGENVFAFAESPLYAHAGFMVDWGSGPGGMQSPAGHRDNIMDGTFREIGVAIVHETNPSTDVGPQVVTEDLGARSQADVFILGVAYADTDGDDFYSIGEGRSGLHVALGGAGADNFATGGYTLESSLTGVQTVTLTGAGLSGAVSVTLNLASGDNVKLDVVNGTELKTSASATVSGAVKTIEAIGASGLSLKAIGAGGYTIQGGAGADTVGAEAGTNYLRGGSGDDSIVGGSGFDDINGNQGNDTCVSGGGDDWVVGGKDNDSLTGSAGQNLVYGNLGNDTCDGGDGDDIVRGGQNDDVIFGGAGDDFVSGDKGNDTITGGAGADRFHTFGAAGIDRVLDFHIAEGDRVQLDPGTVYTVSQVGADTVIDMTGGGQMILVGVQMSTLTGDWIFGA
ncbi:MAG: calcium-binding protein [Phenylobacterium sp.]|uniref:CAP domain-containing protein n=1 Tax=Phenylobacterium sp. TaxID=1871053 RepID=UPI0025FB33CD|nr:CAP domain-containing protein [Phenylobacterium sp.]MBI1196443.1 calcium-binding protein [Phenylobacterium sp.]